MKSWLITLWWYKLCPQIYAHDLEILGRTLYWNFSINLFTSCPEGHNNYLFYIVPRQTVVDSVSVFNIPFLIKNMFQILCLPYKHPDEAEEWIVVVKWYFFWDIMLYHWVVEKWPSEAANFSHLQGVTGPGRILQGPVYPWRLGNYVASKCQELIGGPCIWPCIWQEFKPVLCYRNFRTCVCGSWELF
jgi:hypothetical protein